MGKLINKNILDELLVCLKDRVLAKWYPLVIDKEFGGYFSNISYDWKIMPQQDKMVVTQARHIWTLSKAASFFNIEIFKDYTFQGYKFLKNKMWDSKFGGFYQMRSREGEMSGYQGFYDEKRMYGNAYGIFALAALYELINDKEVSDLAKDAFYWVEFKAADKVDNGYFQFLKREGIPFNKESEYKTKASDAVEVGYKDQNSSIHLLEAYTEFYNVWKSPELYERLKNILFLIRDVITTEKGYLNLFFENKWKPVSFRDAPEGVRKKNYGLDHVSFGHNYETAFLILEGSYVLGLKDDIKTLKKARQMMDHAIENGWDKSSAGFFDEGYYFKKDGRCEIIKDTKVWWAQAEGLNALLLFSKIFPEEKKYYELFLQQWEYIKKYLLDSEYGDWYWGSLEKEPFYKTEPKGTIWKGTYHTCRALMNCIKILADENCNLMKTNKEFRRLKNNSDEFIKSWKKVGKSQS